MGVPTSQAQFDSVFYLQHRPDVADAPANWFPNSATNIGGAVKNHPEAARIAWEHFVKEGKSARWRNSVTGEEGVGATITKPPPAAAVVPATAPTADTPNWLLWGGLALGAFLLLSGRD